MVHVCPAPLGEQERKRRARGSSCAAKDWTIMFSNVSDYMDFIEKSLGKMCKRKKLDELDVAQCW